MVLESMDFLFYKIATFPWESAVILMGIACIPILILNIIYGLIISPLICRFYIVPKIEKKVGRKIGYSFILDILPFGRFFDRDIEISRYIIDRYYAFKKRGERGVPYGYESFALKHVGYTIEMISKAELIFAFSERISFYMGSVSFMIALIAAALSQS